jgi:hypothetical protein
LFGNLAVNIEMKIVSKDVILNKLNDLIGRRIAMDVGLGIVVLSAIMLLLTIFFLSRNSGVGLRLPFLFKSTFIWKKSQMIFYVCNIIFLLLLYIFKQSFKVPYGNYVATCFFFLLFSAIITIIIIKYENAKKS